MPFMGLHNFSADGQSYTSALIIHFIMETLEYFENPVCIILVKANTVVFKLYMIIFFTAAKLRVLLYFTFLAIVDEISICGAISTLANLSELDSRLLKSCTS